MMNATEFVVVLIVGWAFSPDFWPSSMREYFFPARRPVKEDAREVIREHTTYRRTRDFATNLERPADHSQHQLASDSPRKVTPSTSQANRTQPDHHQSTVVEKPPRNLQEPAGGAALDTSAKEASARVQQLRANLLKAEEMLRHQYYVEVFLEEKRDYTDGPVRLVNANDGVKDCLGLLLRFDLSASIKRTLELQHTYLARETWHARQTEENDRVGFEIRNRRRQTSLRLRDVLDGDNTSFDGRTKEDVISELRAEYDVLNDMYKDWDNKEKMVDNSLQSTADGLIKSQIEVMAHIQDAYRYSRLIGDPEKEEFPIEWYDFDEEYNKAYKRNFPEGWDDYDQDHLWSEDEDQDEGKSEEHVADDALGEEKEQSTNKEKCDEHTAGEEKDKNGCLESVREKKSSRRNSIA